MQCPTTIIHGREDAVVPIDSSRRYAGEHDHVKLIEVDDDHPLHASVENGALLLTIEEAEQ